MLGENFATDTHFCSTVSTYRIGNCSYYSVCSLKCRLFRGENCQIILCKKSIINIKNSDPDYRYKCDSENKMYKFN